MGTSPCNDILAVIVLLSYISSWFQVIKHFVNKRPDLWKQLEGKYDPKGIYADKYKDLTAKI